MTSKTFPSISILIPTLNAASVLGKCLESINKQDYPRNKIEIIIADGGSTDKTLAIARKYKARIYSNPLKTGEAGKAVALKKAKGELIALIDSDNLLPDKNWLKKMVEPFADSEIIGSEPWKFTWRSQDGFIDRYCALMGMNDPLCYFLGNYDRLNVLSGKWTGLSLEEKDKGGWIKITLKPPSIPTIGANGTILRREIFSQGNTSDGDPTCPSKPVASGAGRREGLLRGECIVGDYFFDIDIIAQLATKKSIKFAKVKTSITHLYCGSDIKKFIRKQKRRVKDYLYFSSLTEKTDKGRHYQKIGARKYPWQKQNKLGLLRFILSCITILPLIYQSLKGYFKKPDPAWFFHPLACWLTLGVYGWGEISAIFGIKELSRKGWRQ